MGQLSGDRLQLKSESGKATLTAAVTPTQATGDVQVDGQRRPLTLAAAHGVGGLYTATVADDLSRATGRSERGNTYELANSPGAAPGTSGGQRNTDPTLFG